MHFRINPNLGPSFLVMPIVKFSNNKTAMVKGWTRVDSKLHNRSAKFNNSLLSFVRQVPNKGLFVFHPMFHVCYEIGKIPSHHSLFKQWLIIAYHFAIFSFEEILYHVSLPTYLPTYLSWTLIIEMTWSSSITKHGWFNNMQV